MESNGARALVITLGVFAIVAGVVIVLLLTGALGTPGGAPSALPSPSATPSAEPTPTETPTPTPTPTSPGGDLQPTSVVIVFAGTSADGSVLDVDGFAEDVIEDGGTCTALIRGDGGTATASGPALAGSTTTPCRTLHIPLDGLPAGAYRVVLSYLSGTASGESAAVDVEIP